MMYNIEVLFFLAACRNMKNDTLLVLLAYWLTICGCGLAFRNGKFCRILHAAAGHCADVRKADVQGEQKIKMRSDDIFLRRFSDAVDKLDEIVLVQCLRALFSVKMCPRHSSAV